VFNNLKDVSRDIFTVEGKLLALLSFNQPEQGALLREALSRLAERC